MPVWLKAAGKWGSVFVIIALVISLLKQIIAFVGFLTMAIKVIIVLAFIVLFLAVGLVILRNMNSRRKTEE